MTVDATSMGSRNSYDSILTKHTSQGCCSGVSRSQTCSSQELSKRQCLNGDSLVTKHTAQGPHPADSSSSQMCCLQQVSTQQNLNCDSLVTKHTAQGPPSFWKPFMEGEAGCLALPGPPPAAFTRFTGLGGAGSHTCTNLVLLGASHTSSSCSKIWGHTKFIAWQWIVPSPTSCGCSLDSGSKAA